MTLPDLLKARTSIRAFKPDPIPEPVVREILDEARWAPSGGNLQPWKVYAVAGERRQAVIDAVKAKLAEDPLGDESDFPVYPEKLWEPYRTRRYVLGEAMYELLGIPREDKAARLNQLMRNYEFFDAPVGLFFAIDPRMGPGQWAHLGMFMMAVMLSAQARGLATCPQEAWTPRARTVAKVLGLPGDEIVYCGMALGYADAAAPVNRLRSERALVEDFARFEGF